MARLVELLLFVTPIAFYVAALLLGRTINPPVTWSLIGFLALVAAGTIWYGLARSVPRDDVYVPARVENGRIIEGHGVPP